MNPLQEAVRVKADEDGMTLAEIERDLDLYQGTLSSFLTQAACFSAVECRKVARWLGWETSLVKFANNLLREEARAAREMGKAWDITLVDLSGISLPFYTAIGAVRRQPVTGVTGCRYCKVQEACAEASDAGDFVFCERVLQMDLWPEKSKQEMPDECVHRPEYRVHAATGAGAVAV